MKCSFFLVLSTIGFCAGVSPSCSIKDDEQFDRKYMEAIIGFTRCYWKFISIIDIDSPETMETFIKDGTVPKLLKDIHDYATIDHSSTLPPNCDGYIHAFGFECLPLEGKIYVNRTQIAFSRLMEFIFGNDSQRTIDFIESRSFQCCCKEKIFDKCFGSQNSFLLPLIQPFDKEPLSLTGRKEKGCSSYSSAKTCVDDLIPAKCPDARTYISDVIEILKPVVCPTVNTLRKKRDMLFEGRGLLSFIPMRRRTARETGDASIPLYYVVEEKVRTLCGNSKELEDTLKNRKVCLSKKQMFSADRDEYLHHVDECTKDYRLVARKCLPEKSKFIADLYFNVEQSMVKMFYDDAFVMDRGIRPCKSTLNRQENMDIFKKCLAEVAADLQEDPFESEKQVCEKFIETVKCGIKQLNDLCTTNSSLEKFKKDYLEAAERPCNETMYSSQQRENFLLTI